jgi:hypothetical protein
LYGGEQNPIKLETTLPTSPRKCSQPGDELDVSLDLEKEKSPDDDKPDDGSDGQYFSDSVTVELAVDDGNRKKDRDEDSDPSDDGAADQAAYEGGEAEQEEPLSLSPVSIRRTPKSATGPLPGEPYAKRQWSDYVKALPYPQRGIEEQRIKRIDALIEQASNPGEDLGQRLQLFKRVENECLMRGTADAMAQAALLRKILHGEQLRDYDTKVCGLCRRRILRAEFVTHQSSCSTHHREALKEILSLSSGDLGGDQLED